MSAWFSADPAYPQGPSPLVFHGDRAALEPAVVALREAGPEMTYTIGQGLHTLRPHFLSATSSFQALRVWGAWLSASSRPFPTSFTVTVLCALGGCAASGVPMRERGPRPPLSPSREGWRKGGREARSLKAIYSGPSDLNYPPFARPQDDSPGGLSTGWLLERQVTQKQRS